MSSSCRNSEPGENTKPCLLAQSPAPPSVHHLSSVTKGSESPGASDKVYRHFPRKQRAHKNLCLCACGGASCFWPSVQVLWVTFSPKQGKAGQTEKSTTLLRLLRERGSRANHCPRPPLERATGECRESQLARAETHRHKPPWESGLGWET